MLRHFTSFHIVDMFRSLKSRHSLSILVPRLPSGKGRSVKGLWAGWPVTWHEPWSHATQKGHWTFCLACLASLPQNSSLHADFIWRYLKHLWVSLRFWTGSSSRIDWFWTGHPCTRGWRKGSRAKLVAVFSQCLPMKPGSCITCCNWAIGVLWAVISPDFPCCVSGWWFKHYDLRWVGMAGKSDILEKQATTKVPKFMTI